MGCDGGTICERRDLIIKTKKEAKKIDKDLINSTIWTTCHLTKEILSEPIVADKCGFLYNKKDLLECLLDKQKKKKNELIIGHISGLSDLYNVQFTRKKKANSSSFQASSSSSSSIVNCVNDKNKKKKDIVVVDTIDKTSVGTFTNALFICPVTGEEIRGQFNVYLLKKCGHVISEEALDLARKDGACIVCECKFSSSPLSSSLDQAKTDKNVLHLDNNSSKESNNKDDDGSVPIEDEDVLQLNPPLEVSKRIQEELLLAAKKKRKEKKEKKSKKKKMRKVEKEVEQVVDINVPKNADEQVYKSIFL
ncbi:hypothetical protein ABK040_011483 [Willaertia magna]